MRVEQTLYGQAKADWVSVLCAAFTLIVYFVVKILRPRWPVFAITLIVVSLGFWALAGFGSRVTTFSDATFTWREAAAGLSRFCLGERPH